MAARWVRTAALAALAVAASARAADVYVVTGNSTDLAAADVADVYKGEKQFAGETKLVIVDNASAQADFLSRVVKVEPQKYASIWARKTFREGMTPPVVKGTDGEVLAAIKANPATIGYVTKPTPDVKVIGKF